MNVAEIMTKRVISVAPTTKVKQVAALLRTKKISGVPVLEGGSLVGIVTEADILARKPGQNLVRNIMKTDVATVGADTDVKTVAARLARRGTGRLGVVRGGNVVGIITRADVVRLIAQGSASLGGRSPASDRLRTSG